MTDGTTDQVRSIQDLTSTIITGHIWKAYYGNPLLELQHKGDTMKNQVVAYQVQPIPTAVLSQVYSLALTYRQPKEYLLPKRLIAKFRRDETSERFGDMFRVERNFYNLLFSSTSSSSIREADLPFRVPKLIHGSLSCLMLEQIEDVQTYSVLQACPAHHMEPILERLAKLHALFWKFEEDDNEHHRLADPAGIGSELDGTTKASQFPSLWKKFIQEDSICIDDSTRRTSLEQLCRNMLANIEVAQLHDHLHSKSNMHYWTLIHGDFHIGNMLFPNDENDDNEATSCTRHNHDIWLVDWAMAGRGNPMRDVVFFLIVSGNFWSRESMDVNNQQVEHYLQYYYAALCQAAESNHSNKKNTNFNQEEFTLQGLRRAYRTCLLNQFVILACYDGFCRQLSEGQPDLWAHFQRVNTNCALALLDAFPNPDADLMNLLEI